MDFQASLNATYLSLQDAEIALQEFSRHQGFAVSRARSNKDKLGEIRKIVLKCVHRSTYNASGSIRDRSTIKTNCRWEVIIRRAFEPTHNRTVWNSEVVNAEHQGHEPQRNPAAYSSHRTLGVEEEEELISTMNLAGASPRLILSTLRSDNPECMISSKDIQNAKQKIRESTLNGRLPVEALLDRLETEQVFFKVRNSTNGKLMSLFFAPKSSIKIAQEYSANSVFIMDSTYKTNKYKMPILHIVGVTATNQPISLSFCFLSEENEENYYWAIKQFSECFRSLIDPNNLTVVVDRELALIHGIEQAFPNASVLICLWHINKNVQVKVRPFCETAEKCEEMLCLWRSLCCSRTEVEYNERLKIIQEQMPVIVFQYLEQTWLRNYKHRFVQHFTRDVLHFGHVVTSRVEGSHAFLKKWILVSTADINEVYGRIILASDSQSFDIGKQIHLERMQLPKRFSGLFWAYVVRKVSKSALKLVYEKYLQAIQPDRNRDQPTQDICYEIFTSTMGLPCKHRLKHLISNNMTLNITDFHRHWWLHQPVPPPSQSEPERSITQIFDSIVLRCEELNPHQKASREAQIRSVLKNLESTSVVRITEPNVVCTRGRPSLPSIERSTRRDPSLFEIVESSQRPKRRCGNCQQQGHNKRRCTSFREN